MEMGGDEMMMTSGATGRIVPVFRSVLSRRALLRLAVALHSLFLWLLLLVGRRRRPDAASPAEPGRLGKARSRRRAAEEEDVRRRRALAEEVPMVEDDADADGRTCGTFVIAGARRNALFCRVWAPAAGAETRGILLIVHGLNEHRWEVFAFCRAANIMWLWSICNGLDRSWWQ
uniref:Serine aminopeptidase S33 domain-containing protein n=1 Tax=Aegilops tauschii subsp. strangulata TaxID=200361 RepID=A0A453EDH5_AEGTS